MGSRRSTAATKKPSAAKRPAKRKAKGAARSPAAKKVDRKGAATMRDTADVASAAVSAVVRAPSRVQAALGPHARDVYGLATITISLIIGLGLYAGGGGALGRFLAAFTQASVGLSSHAVPPALFALGMRLVIVDPEPKPWRTRIAALIALTTLLGAWHLAAGAPTLAEGWRGLWDAAGIVGWAVITPLRAAIGTVGTVLTLTTVAAGASAVFFDIPVRDLITRAPRPSDLADVVVTTAKPASKATTKPEKAEKPAKLKKAERAAAPRKSHEQKAAVVLPPIPTTLTDYKLPEMSLLKVGSAKENGEALSRQTTVAADGQSKIQQTLAEFKVDAEVTGFSVGPTITQFEVELGAGVPVKKLIGMSENLAYTLAAPHIRVAQILGRSAMGIEVPNDAAQMVRLGEILTSEQATHDPHPMKVALGVDHFGEAKMIDLRKLPHLLVAGATGSGKSVTVNGFISSILMRARPDQVRMILVDPKQVELTTYNKAPHLLTPVVTDPRRAVDALQWAVKEMENRYSLLAHFGISRDIEGFNQAVIDGALPPVESVAGFAGAEAVLTAPDEEGVRKWKPLPYIVIVVDELADLMMTASRDVEDALTRIAAKARAVGIHAILATQRPSVDVITGVLRANLPARLALSVATATDSKVILDHTGAEKLVGNGDLLFLDGKTQKPSRLQGCFVSEAEVASIVDATSQQHGQEHIDGVVMSGEAAASIDRERAAGTSAPSTAGSPDEQLLHEAIKLVVDSGLGSVSMLQRKLRIGFARAGRLMDELEQIGVVGPNEGSKAREVLIGPDQIDTLLGGADDAQAEPEPF